MSRVGFLVWREFPPARLRLQSARLVEVAAGCPPPPTPRRLRRRRDILRFPAVTATQPDRAARPARPGAAPPSATPPSAIPPPPRAAHTTLRRAARVFAHRSRAEQGLSPYITDPEVIAKLVVLFRPSADQDRDDHHDGDGGRR